MSIDIVCGKEVSGRKACQKKYGDRPYYFCCTSCRDNFNDNPYRHLDKTPPSAFSTTFTQIQKRK